MTYGYDHPRATPYFDSEANPSLDSILRWQTEEELKGLRSLGRSDDDPTTRVSLSEPERSQLDTFIEEKLRYLGKISSDQKN